MCENVIELPFHFSLDLLHILNHNLLFRSPFFTSLLTNGNYFFTAIFAIESFIKLAAMSPRYFFAVSEFYLYDYQTYMFSF